ncbi:hypothetical protein WMY93_019637 [Mugilogobius chulae]|uniref:Uncharacterized protein n=1 Tax=Mugilogobius chulae TaxID=88201 RepID=A0AAW0NIZ7_9GOBI
MNGPALSFRVTALVQEECGVCVCVCGCVCGSVDLICGKSQLKHTFSWTAQQCGPCLQQKDQTKILCVLHNQRDEDLVTHVFTKETGDGFRLTLGSHYIQSNCGLALVGEVASTEIFTDIFTANLYMEQVEKKALTTFPGKPPSPRFRCVMTLL